MSNPYNWGVLLSTYPSGPNTQQAVTIQPPEGYLVGISVFAGQTCPRGRVFCQVSLQNPGAPIVLEPTSGAPFQGSVGLSMPLWTGYVTENSGGSSSMPNMYVYGIGQLIQAVFSYGSNAAATDQYTVQLLMTDSKPSLTNGPFLFYEQPGSGKGEIIRTGGGTASAGSDVALTVIGAYTCRKVRGYTGTLTTSAAAANRQPVFQTYGANTTAGHINAASAVPQFQTASMTWTYSWNTGGNSTQLATATIGSGPINVNASIAEEILVGGQVGSQSAHYGVVTTNLQAGDAWTGVGTVVEEWALPWTNSTLGG